MTRMGINRTFATFLVFCFSAIMHEVIISLPFRYIAFHAFFGMLAQAPLIIVTKWIDKQFDNAFVGNAIFWCLFCVVGQPMGLIMYYFDIWKISQ
jgi:diacylglycerol O-acyltransferase-1